MQGLIESVRTICTHLKPQIPFFLYTPTRFVISRNGGTLNFRLACEIVRTEGNQKTIEDVKRLKEAHMDIDEDSYQVKYIKILNNIKPLALNHCPKCMEKYESFMIESEACEISDINHYRQRISDLSKAAFHFSIEIPKQQDIFDEFYDKRIEELIEYFTNTPPFDFIFAFEYYDGDDDRWKIKSFENFEDENNKMKGSDYLMELFLF
jgi:hypothetical protein